MKNKWLALCVVILVITLVTVFFLFMFMKGCWLFTKPGFDLYCKISDKIINLF